MVRRIVITLGSLLFFYTLFLFYTYVAVPHWTGVSGTIFITTSQSESQEPHTGDPQVDPGKGNDDLLGPYRDYLKILFPGENDWRHSDANLVIPNSGEGLLLFRGEPKLLNNERTVRFNTCTIVLLDNEQGLNTMERYRRSLVLETSENITMTFAKPLSNLTEMDFSSFESGELKGQVIIRSDQKSPGTEDDLLIKTRNVSFSAKQILANSDIIFQLGKQYGEGEGLTIELSLPYFAKHADNETNTESLSPLEQMVKEGNLGGGVNIKLVELKQLRRLEFSLDDSSMLQKLGGFGNPIDKKDAESGGFNEKSTVDIRCKNGFRFAPNSENRSEWIGRFLGEVELLILNEQAKQDSLKCDSLYLYLTDPLLEQLLQQDRHAFPPTVQKKMPSGRLMELELRKFKAVRTTEAPASIDSPRYSFHAEGDEIHYDLQKNEVILNAISSAQRVLLTKDTIFIQSEGIKYLPGKNKGEFGTVVAGKNGVMEAVFELQGQIQRFRSSWGDGLQVLPVADNPEMIRLQMIGGVDFSIDGIGHIQAQEAVFWGEVVATKKENSTDSGNPLESINPLGGNFRGNVRLTTTNGSGTIHEEVVVRFQDETDPTAITADTPNGKSNSTATGNFAIFGERQDTQFEMEAGKLDLWINTGKKQPEVSQLVIRKNVRFWQKNIADPTEAIRIEGDEVQIDNPTTTNTVIHLIGNTAHFSGKKLQLTGYQISLDEKNNSFSVLGPGKLTILSQPKSNLGSVFSTDPIDVSWSREMTFDGKNLHFLANQGEFVTVSQKMSSIRAPEMVLSLKKMVSILDLQTNVGQLEESSFADELDYLECKGTADQRVMIDFCNVGVPNNQSLNNITQNISQGYYRGEFGNFHIQFPQGDFVGQGPGWIRASVKYETPTNDDAPNQPTENNAAGLLSGNLLALPWKQLHLVFQESITGNIYNKIVSANRMVDLAFTGTADQETDLDVTKPEHFPADCVYLNCQKLQLSQIATIGNKETLEFLATGNTIFHYNEYLGRAESIKYSDAKNMIFLLGEGRSQASLYKRPRPGIEAVSLGNFMRGSFNLKTQKVEVENYDNSGSSFSPIF